MWSWLIGMSQDGKAYADAALYLFTFLGLALVPSRFGRKAWWILAWFAAVNAIRLAFPPPGEPQSRTLAALGWALGQGPWLAFLFTMALRPGVRAFIAAVPVRQILLWHAFRLMGVHLGIAALTGVFGDEDAQRIALQGGFGETLTGLAALGLYCVYDPESQRMRAAALFWNTYGATSIFVLNAKT